MVDCDPSRGGDRLGEAAPGAWICPLAAAGGRFEFRFHFTAEQCAAIKEQLSKLHSETAWQTLQRL